MEDLVKLVSLNAFNCMILAVLKILQLKSSIFERPRDVT